MGLKIEWIPGGEEEVKPIGKPRPRELRDCKEPIFCLTCCYPHEKGECGIPIHSVMVQDFFIVQHLSPRLRISWGN